MRVARAILTVAISPPHRRASALAGFGSVLRAELELLGGVFIKFGQILSSRGDFLPPVVLVQLFDLLDRVRPEDFQTSMNTLEDALGRGRSSNLLTRIISEPIGAGSFATVYRACTADGDEIALKIRRAGVETQVEADLAVIRIICRMLDATLLFGRFKFGIFFKEFSAWTMAELDYELEARYMHYLKRKLGRSSRVYIPGVHWELTSSRVLATELVRGVWISDFLSGRRDLHVEIRRRLSNALFQSFFEQVFEVGLFHADPHGGNICLMDDHRIGLIDFGLSAFISHQLKISQQRLLTAVQDGDTDQAYSALIKVLHVPPDANSAQFKTDFADNIRSWLLLQVEPGLQAIDRSGAKLLLANFNAARQAGLIFRSDMALYYRAFIIADGVISRLNPGFNYTSQIGRFFLRQPGAELTAGAVRLLKSTGSYDSFVTVREFLRMKIDIEPADQYFNYTLYKLGRFVHVIAIGSKYVSIAAVFLACLTLSHIVSGQYIARLMSFQIRPTFLIEGLVTAWIVCRFVARALWVAAYDIERPIPSDHRRNNCRT
jgi:predicted unusual protein kinase regulating ubiquinone biosynthesis (AarF/ABC1/UbiB family)